MWSQSYHFPSFFRTYGMTIRTYITVGRVQGILIRKDQARAINLLKCDTGRSKPRCSRHTSAHSCVRAACCQCIASCFGNVSRSAPRWLGCKRFWAAWFSDKNWNFFFSLTLRTPINESFRDRVVLTYGFRWALLPPQQIRLWSNWDLGISMHLRSCSNRYCFSLSFFRYK